MCPASAVGSLDILLQIIQYLPQEDQARFCLLNKDISSAAHHILYRHLKFKTGANLTDIQNTISFFEQFESRPDAPCLKYATASTRTIELLPSKLIKADGVLWPDLKLQYRLVEIVARRIDRFPKLVNFYWHQPLGYGMDVQSDREGKDGLGKLWKKLTALPNLKRIYILEYYPNDWRTWGGHIRHFGCLRDFATRGELYESQDVGKQYPNYQRVDEAWIEDMRAGPCIKCTCQPKRLIPLHEWEVEINDPDLEDCASSPAWFTELMMPLDCEMY